VFYTFTIIFLSLNLHYIQTNHFHYSTYFTLHYVLQYNPVPDAKLSHSIVGFIIMQITFQLIYSRGLGIQRCWLKLTVRYFHFQSFPSNCQTSCLDFNYKCYLWVRFIRFRKDFTRIVTSEHSFAYS